MRRVIVLFLVLALSPVCADQYADIVERAFNALDNDYKESWSFTETSTEDDEVRVATYDPRNPEDERWTLVSVDDRAPTDKEIRSFRDGKQSRRKNQKQVGREALSVRPGTLKLRQETDAHWTFDFVPAEDDDGDKVMQYVNGTLGIVKDGHYVESIVLKNEAPIKLFIGVKIKTLHVQLSFGPAAMGGPIVPLDVDTRVEGRALLAIRFNESDVVRFSDYKHVGGLEEMVPDR